MSLKELSLRIQKPFVKEKREEAVNEFLMVHHFLLRSRRLKRKVKVDVYLPSLIDGTQPTYGLLLNDGQDAGQLKLIDTLTERFRQAEKCNLIVVGIHAGDRLNEYGTAGFPDYKGRGWKARSYTNFVIYQLLPFLQAKYDAFHVKAHNAFAGFSLGGLSAMDMGWKHPEHFSGIGVFSGSFWWRSEEFNPEAPDADRIMHDYVRMTDYKEGLKFWFQAGTEDEEADRNNNGVIDAIDDTLDLMKELKAKGYTEEDMTYVEVEGGKHNFDTWSEVFPDFLDWWIG